MDLRKPEYPIRTVKTTNPINCKKGYTLIELTVVLVLIGLLITLTVPRFRYAILTDSLKSTTRRMIGIINNLRSEAVREQKTFFLRFDLQSNRFWTDWAGTTEEERLLSYENASSLPRGVRILDVWLAGKGKKMGGETAIRFNEKGYVQQSVIHLGSEDGREFTLVLSPFLRKVKVLESYVEFEES